MWGCGNREGLICKPVTMNFFESCRPASEVCYFNENLIACITECAIRRYSITNSLVGEAKPCP